VIFLRFCRDFDEFVEMLVILSILYYFGQVCILKDHIRMIKRNF
jgi:hypothetical protein